jgi:hypothetical protein
MIRFFMHISGYMYRGEAGALRLGRRKALFPPEADILAARAAQRPKTLGIALCPLDQEDELKFGIFPGILNSQFPGFTPDLGKPG